MGKKDYVSYEVTSHNTACVPGELRHRRVESYAARRGATRRSNHRGTTDATGSENLGECSLFLTRLLRHLGIHQRRGVVVGKESHQVRRLLQGMDALLDLRKQAIGNMLREHDLARGRDRVRSGSHLCEWEGRMIRSNWDGREYTLYFQGGLWRRGIKRNFGTEKAARLSINAMPAFGPSHRLQTASSTASSSIHSFPANLLGRLSLGSPDGMVLTSDCWLYDIYTNGPP